MPVAYNVPTDWLGKPADPAAYYGTGFQMGVRLGAEQAANQYRQQQILLEQQKMAFENQYAQQKQALEVADVIQKQRAIASYQGMINQGVDPMRALQFVGPSLGVDPSRIAAIEESRVEREAQMQANQQRWAAQSALGRQREQRLESQGEERLRLAAERQKAETEAKTATVEPRFEERNGLTYMYNPKTGHWEFLDKSVSKQDFIAKNVNKWMISQMVGPEEAAKQMDEFYETNIRKTVGTKGEGVGDNIMPDRKPERVRMRSPDGKTGTLPSDQVDAAVAQGWNRL